MGRLTRRYEVIKQIEEINNADAILDLLNNETMKPPTKEELEFAIKKAHSCISLTVSLLCENNITIREIREGLRKSADRIATTLTDDEKVEIAGGVE